MGQKDHDCADADRSQSPRLVKATMTASIQYCERVASRTRRKTIEARSWASVSPARVAEDERSDLHVPDAVAPIDV